MTTEIILDGNAIKSEADVHDVIQAAAQALGFVGYGRNLDAALDVITGILPLPVHVRWLNSGACRDALGDRFGLILSVFRYAEERLGSSFRCVIEP